MDEISSLPETTLSDEYRLADVAFYPSGHNNLLAHAKSTDSTRLLHRIYADLLMQCSEFKTLDEHLHTFCEGKQISERVVVGLRQQLQHLAQDGYLFSQRQLHHLFGESSEQSVPCHISTIGFPTCNRVKLLQRGMTSYIEHCQHFGRSHDFAVMDDSQTPAMREAYRDMLRTWKTH